MSEEQVQEQSTKVVEMGENKPAKRGKAPENKAVPQAQAQPKMFLISEQAVNQLLNTVAELQGLTWKQTNPIIAFIQQNVTPYTGQ